MKWKVLVVSAVALVAVYLIRAHVQTLAQKDRELSYQLKLNEYTEHFQAGLTRRQVEAQLRKEGVTPNRICCLNGRGSVSTDLVKINEEKGPWYCKGFWVNIAFDYHAVKPHDFLKSDDADVLDKVSIFRLPDSCL